MIDIPFSIDILKELLHSVEKQYVNFASNTELRKCYRF